MVSDNLRSVPPPPSQCVKRHTPPPHTLKRKACGVGQVDDASSASLRLPGLHRLRDVRAHRCRRRPRLVPARAVQFEEASTAKDRGAAALREMGVSGALCFTGMVDKAQRLFSLEKPNTSMKSGGGCFKGLTHGKVKEEGQLAVQGKDTGAGEPAARGKGVAPTGGIEVDLTAYSLDQPDLVRSMVSAKGGSRS